MKYGWIWWRILDTGKPYLTVPPGLVQHDARGERRGAQQLPRVETPEPRLDGRGGRDHLRYHTQWHSCFKRHATDLGVGQVYPQVVFYGPPLLDCLLLHFLLLPRPGLPDLHPPEPRLNI